VGGILLGLYADHKGRKSALLLIIILMTVAIAMIGFAPTYAAIGVAAPLIIVLARLLQGLATGGEFASATSFLIESAPSNRRGFYGSWQMVGQGLAVLIGALLGALITRTLATEALDSWGWRIPFLLGLIIGPVGLFIRRHLQETDAFLEARGATSVRQSFGTALATHTKDILVCMGIVTSGTISFYVILLYMPTFRPRAITFAIGSSLHRPGDWPRVHDRDHPAFWRAVGPHWSQADYDRSAVSVFCPRVSAFQLAT
jgi:MFS transporter, MHS family, proline/betaine transporter